MDESQSTDFEDSNTVDHLEQPDIKDEEDTDDSNGDLNHNWNCPSCEYNEQLQSRILSLRKTIKALKGQLNEEREIWKKEIEERRESEYINRATQYGLDFYKEIDSNELTNYQNQILQAHFEKRQLLEKQIAMSNYKRRLLEVENMCNLELLRVKQSVQILQPLQVMCSEWRFPEESERGDFNRNPENEDEANKEETAETDKQETAEKDNRCEVEMPLEVLAQTLDAETEKAEVKQSQSQPSLINVKNA